MRTKPRSHLPAIRCSAHQTTQPLTHHRTHAPHHKHTAPHHRHTAHACNTPQAYRTTCIPHHTTCIPTTWSLLPAPFAVFAACLWVMLASGKAPEPKAEPKRAVLRNSAMKKPPVFCVHKQVQTHRRIDTHIRTRTQRH